jgi:protein TonB
MGYPDSATARLREDAQLRTLCACFAASLALHALAMFAFPGLRPADRPAEMRALTALFAAGAERAELIAPVAPPRRSRERREPETPAPLPKPVEPTPVAAPSAEQPAPASAPSLQPAATPSLASSAPLPALPTPSPEAPDASLLDAYRLALIDAAKRYKRYPAQAMERGWEGRVEIRVVVGANGMIKSALVKRSSRYQILDDQALDMVRRAFNALTQDKPAPRGHEFIVDVPVIFELQTG